MFVEGKSAMFHGHPTVMQQLQKPMDAELIRIPYFSQTSDESYVYMTPSLNIAFNKNLEKDREKLDTALDVLDCMISEEGAKADCGWKRCYFIEYRCSNHDAGCAWTGRGN